MPPHHFGRASARRFPSINPTCICQIVRHPSFMNRIFKAVWNESSGTWVAASETSKSKTKRSSSAGKLVMVQAAMICGLLAASSAHAQVRDEWAAPAAGLMAAPVMTGANAYAAGEDAVAGGDLSTAIGYQATSPANNATAIGNGTRANGVNSFAAGNFATSQGPNSVAVGNNSMSSATNSVAIGDNTLAQRDYTTAIGSNATASADQAIALGVNATA